jgi:hypothetical protein
MKSLIFFLICILALSSLASAFQIKYYGSHYEDVKVENSLCDVPEKYFDGLRAIKVFERSNGLHPARYWDGGVIESFEDQIDCHLLVHELAHHCQFIRRDTNYNRVHHLGMFNDCQEEIVNAIS